MACKKCDPHEICEECPEWIFTLADLIMCMMGLFVLLWVLKESGAKASSPQVAQQKETEWFRGFQQGFQGYPVNAMEDPTPLKALNGPGQEGASRDRPETPDGTQALATMIRPGQTVATGGRLPFAAGQSTLEADVQKRVDAVADTVRGHRMIILVKGHASRDDLGGDAEASKTMAISLARAQAVADRLVARGVDPEVIRVQGCGTFEPIRQGDSSTAGQSVNRRVEVVVSDTLVDEFQNRQAVIARPD